MPVTVTSLGAGTAVHAVSAETVWTVVETGTSVETTTVLRAGQSVTVAAHEVMVISLVE
jgi:hypothetical protein